MQSTMQNNGATSAPTTAATLGCRACNVARLIGLGLGEMGDLNQRILVLAHEQDKQTGDPSVELIREFLGTDASTNELIRVSKVAVWLRLGEWTPGGFVARLYGSAPRPCWEVWTFEPNAEFGSLLFVSVKVETKPLTSDEDAALEAVATLARILTKDAIFKSDE